MADPRFFSRAGPFTLVQLAEITGAEARPASDPDAVFRDVGPLETAGPEQVSFLDNRQYLDAYRKSRAGACFVEPVLAPQAPEGMAPLITPQPYRAYALAARAFYPAPVPAGERAPSAVIDPSATLGEGTEVEAGAVIGARAEIGRRCRVGANAVIGPGVIVGDDSIIGACASLSHCLIGARVMIYPGARIGQDGFGFAMGPEGHLKVPQLGRVVVHDDVEVGANTTIDRGTSHDTVVGAGCIIDNLVQIGHNVQIGRGCVIVAQVGISGSTKLGDRVLAGGQVGFSGHLRIGDGARIAAGSGVIKDVPPGAAVGGYPAVPVRQWHRQTVALARLAQRKGE